MKKIFPSNIFQALLLLLIGPIAAAPFVFISEKYLKQLSNDLTNTIMFVLVCIVIIFFARMISSKRKMDTSYGFKIPRKFWGSILITVLLIVIFQAGINLPVSKILGYYINGQSVFSNPFNQIPVFLGAILLAPLFEELIFRGIIMKGFLARYTPKMAIILSGILFCAIHVQPVQLFGALCFGLLSGWIYFKTESLGFCILLHCISNLSSQLISYALFEANLSGNTSLPYIYGLYTIPIICISVLIVSYLIMALKKEFKSTSKVLPIS